MDKKIEEKIRIMHKNMSELYAHENLLISPAEIVKAIFPEAFEPEKHEAIDRLDQMIKCWGKMQGADVTSLRFIRSYFNDDGTLKDGQRGGV